MPLRFTSQPSKLPLTFYTMKVPAGFPSPAEDHVEGRLDLNEHLVRRPAATYFVRADGESMKDVGIFSDDLLVVDRSIQPSSGDVVIAVVNGDLTVKKLIKRQQNWALAAANPCYDDILLSDAGCDIWGVVTHSIRQHCKS